MLNVQALALGSIPIGANSNGVPPIHINLYVLLQGNLTKFSLSVSSNCDITTHNYIFDAILTHADQSEFSVYLVWAC